MRKRNTYHETINHQMGLRYANAEKDGMRKAHAAKAHGTSSAEREKAIVRLRIRNTKPVLITFPKESPLRRLLLITDKNELMLEGFDLPISPLAIDETMVLILE